MTQEENDWFWMMDFCKKKGLPPAQKWAWDMALEELAKEKYIKKDNYGR